MFAECFDVSDQRAGVAAIQVGEVVDCSGRAAPAPALIEANDEVALRVEPTAVAARSEAAAGTAVEVQGGTPLRVTRGLPIDLRAIGTAD